MGWRDRVKKSFGDFEDIGEGIQNLKNQEKERKEGLKTTFIHYPHNTQNPQNPKKGGAKQTGRLKSENIPAPSPPGLGPEYAGLWNIAWLLADFIDNPAAATIEERRAKLPELNQMRERMATIERRGITGSTGPRNVTNGRMANMGAGATTTRDRNPETCPARCNETDRCYGRACGLMGSRDRSRGRSVAKINAAG